jgi:hypothetical protein
MPRNTVHTTSQVVGEVLIAICLIFAQIGESADLSKNSQAITLPLIPFRGDVPTSTLPDGVIPNITGNIPAVPPPNPDEVKALYGYYGPFYSVEHIDDTVRVIARSVYVWPIETWKATGMLRNQTHSSARIKALTVRLLGAQGEILDTANATVPIEELRPGEPGPFIVETAVPAEKVASVDWLIDYDFSQSAQRLFEVEVYTNQYAADSGYYLFGEIGNDSDIGSSVRMVAAWLDKAGRVLYIDSPKIAYAPEASNSPTFLDIAYIDSDHFEHFVYINADPSIALALEKASVALWSTSK